MVRRATSLTAPLERNPDPVPTAACRCLRKLGPSSPTGDCRCRADLQWCNGTRFKGSQTCSGLRRQPSVPTAEMSNGGPATRPNCFADKPADPRSIGKLDLANAKWRWDAINEAAEVFSGQFPVFHVKGGTALGDAYHALGIATPHNLCWHPHIPTVGLGISKRP